MDESIHDITSRIAAGDTEAFSRLYRTWFDPMLAEARRTSGRDESFCLDVVQDAMLQVIRSLPPLEHEGALRRWLERTVRSCACDRVRSETRRRGRECAATAAGARPQPADATELAWLRREVDRLEEPARSLVLLRHRLGLTLAQIGAVTGLGPGAVDGRLRRALAALGRRAKEVLDD